MTQSRADRQRDREGDAADDGTEGPSAASRWLAWGMAATWHAGMAGVVGVVVLAATFRPAAVREIFSSAAGTYQPDWLAVGGLLASSLCLWLLLWVAVRYAWDAYSGRDSAAPQAGATRAAGRGAVLTETLIVLVPFLLLTSGVAQITMNQSASIMAHYAAYQGARTHWVWHDERDAQRGSGSLGQTATTARIRKKSRLAAALVLAPSAPADFMMSATDDDVVDDMRSVMTASFSAAGVGSGVAGSAGTSLDTGRHENLTFSKALGGTAFPVRASRKLGFTYTALGEDSNFRLVHQGGDVEQIGVDFSYPLQQAFPWFAYIHSGSNTGCSQTVAGRVGCYITLDRQAVLNEQVGVYGDNTASSSGDQDYEGQLGGAL